MANPNIVNVSTITGKTALVQLTTVTSNVIVNTGGSSTIDKLNNIILTNYSASSVSANVVINRSSTIYYVGGNIVIPSFSTLILLGKDTAVYLEEGDTLQANVSSNTAISMAASYEIIS